MRDGIKIDRVD